MRTRNDHCTHPDQKWCDCDWCRLLRDRAKLPPAYAAILDKAEELELPKSFKGDLTEHDRLWIERNPDSPFFWGPYEMGTHLSPVTEPRLVPREVVDFVRENKGECFWWDGAQLIDFAKACRMAA